MENSKLFQLTANGYNCSQVDEYLSILRNEYKKVFDYAKAREAEVAAAKAEAEKAESEMNIMREKLTALEEQISEMESSFSTLIESTKSDEGSVKTLPDTSTDSSVLLRTIETMNLMSEEIIKENKSLRERLAKIESID